MILADVSKALEADCKSKLEKRMEMFRNAAPVIEFSFRKKKTEIVTENIFFFVN